MDDESILDEDSLWRRIPPLLVIDDDNLGFKRPSRGAFQNSSDGSGMSVDLAKETTIEDTLKGYEDCFIVEFTAGFARGLNQGIVRKPLECNSAHAEVIGNKTKAIRGRFTKNSKWIVDPN